MWALVTALGVCGQALMRAQVQPISAGMCLPGIPSPQTHHVGDEAMEVLMAGDLTLILGGSIAEGESVEVW